MHAQPQMIVRDPSMPSNNLPSTFERAYLHALAVLAATLVDVLSRCVAAHKGDGLDVRVIADTVDCVVCAVDDVQHPSAGSMVGSAFPVSS